MTPIDTADAAPPLPPSTTAYPQRVSPGSIPSTRVAPELPDRANTGSTVAATACMPWDRPGPCRLSSRRAHHGFVRAAARMTRQRSPPKSRTATDSKPSRLVELDRPRIGDLWVDHDRLGAVLPEGAGHRRSHHLCAEGPPPVVRRPDPDVQRPRSRIDVTPIVRFLLDGIDQLHESDRPAVLLGDQQLAPRHLARQFSRPARTSPHYAHPERRQHQDLRPTSPATADHRSASSRSSIID